MSGVRGSSVQTSRHGDMQPIYWVGGAVRDPLLGRIPNDWDIALEGDVREYAGCLARVVGGKALLLRHDHLEGYDVVRVTPSDGSRSFDVTAMYELDRSLARSDLTINAMVVPLHIDPSLFAQPDTLRPSVVDPFGGIRDMEDRVIKAVPGQWLGASRMMRTIRLAVQYDFELDPEAGEDIRGNAHTVRPFASGKPHFLSALRASRDGRALRLMDELGLLRWPIVSYDRLRRSKRTWGFRLSASVDRLLVEDSICDGLRTHFARPVSEGVDRLTALKIAALLIDMGLSHTDGKEVNDAMAGLALPQRVDGVIIKILRCHADLLSALNGYGQSLEGDILNQLSLRADSTVVDAAVLSLCALHATGGREESIEAARRTLRLLTESLPEKTVSKSPSPGIVQLVDEARGQALSALRLMSSARGISDVRDGTQC